MPDSSVTPFELSAVSDQALLAEYRRRWPHSVDLELVDDDVLIASLSRRFDYAFFAGEKIARPGVEIPLYRNHGPIKACIGLCETMQAHLVEAGLKQDRMNADDGEGLAT